MGGRSWKINVLIGMPELQAQAKKRVQLPLAKLAPYRIVRKDGDRGGAA